MNLTTNETAIWMNVAWHEYFLWQENAWTISDTDGCERAQFYINITGEYFTPSAAGWCGCFIDWVLKFTNKIYHTDFSTVICNPSSSQNYAFKKRYPNSVRIKPRFSKIPYGAIAVLHSSGWKGHVGFVVNSETIAGKRYVYLLGGNQEGKVCVQQFEVYKNGSKFFYKTKKGTIYRLKGYCFPSEYQLENIGEAAYEYYNDGYEIEENFN